MSKYMFRTFEDFRRFFEESEELLVVPGAEMEIGLFDKAGTLYINKTILAFVDQGPPFLIISRDTKHLSNIRIEGNKIKINFIEKVLDRSEWSIKFNPEINPNITMDRVLDYMLELYQKSPRSFYQMMESSSEECCSTSELDDDSDE